MTSSSLVNFKKTIAHLTRSVGTPVTEPRDLSGILKDFEMSYELSWKVLKKKLREAGHDTQGAKDVYAKAYQLGYLDDEKVWLEMIADRNHSTHVYDEGEALKITQRVKAHYLPALQKLLILVEQESP